MISYNKERGAWDFKDCSADEKEVLLELGEKAWASAVAQALARRWMQEEMEEAQAACGTTAHPAEPNGHPEEQAQASIFFPDFGSKTKQ